ncbi:MAG TPA: hypothetical protein DDZ67_09800 [Xanthomonadaceae bacterium]|nr:hypothetical protein [Xanthomonadaceae bacterium]
MLARARRLPAPLRLLLLALLAFGVVGSPLASALADVHMLAHDAGDAHAHERSDEDPAASGESAGDQLLHALVHCGHCHGQGGVLPPATPLTLPAPTTQICPGLEALLPLHGRLDSPFRPPIAA